MSRPLFRYIQIPHTPFTSREKLGQGELFPVESFLLLLFPSSDISRSNRLNIYVDKEGLVGDVRIG